MTSKSSNVRRWLLSITLIWVVTGSAMADPKALDIAEAFLSSVEQGQMAQAHAMFDDTAASALSADRLAAVWSQLADQLGGYRGRGPWRVEQLAGRAVYVTRLEFAQAALDARISIDAVGRVDGFRIVPAAPVSEPEAVAGVREIEFKLGGELPALLALPEGDGPFPAVVLVHGSGPNDRDQTIGPNRSFRDLAMGLARRGVASLRYDKRTRVQPERFRDRAYTVQDEVIDDVLLAVETLRKRPEIDASRVGLVGHSLGAMLAPRIAGLIDPPPYLLVLLAPPARSLQALVVEQVNHVSALDGVIDAEEAQQLENLRAQAREATKASPGSAAPSLLGLPQSYLADLNAHDPVQAARRLAIPMLILQGGRDYQVSAERDFARWREALEDHPDTELVLIDELDHLFRPGEGPSRPGDYLRPGPAFAPVIDRIADFLLESR
ncbi:MAG: alpha/beta fold hydrolase [Wenzhouxiangellaceae bacterium]